MRKHHLIAVIGTTGLLAACGTSDDTGTGGTESTTPATNSTATDGGASHDALAEALAMVGNDGTMPGDIGFIHQSRINELTEEHEPWRDIGTDPTWQILSYAGTTPDDPHGESVLRESSTSYLPMPDDLMRLELPAADTILFAGDRFDGGVRLVNGGQDTGQIEEAARGAGWAGEAPLLEYGGHQPSIPEGLQLLLRGDSSVATAGPGVDMSVVDPDGTTLADQATVTVLRECLGDAVRASVRYQIRPDATDWFATGVVAGEDGPYSVVCSLFRDTDTAERVGERAVETVSDEVIPDLGPVPNHLGTGDHSGRPYSDFFSSAEVSVEEIDDVTGEGRTAMLRTELPHTGDAPLGTIFALGDSATPGAI